MAKKKVKKPKKKKRHLLKATTAPSKPKVASSLSEESLNHEIEKLLKQGLNAEEIKQHLHDYLRPLVAQHTANMSPEKRRAFMTHIMHKTEELVDQRVSGMSIEALRETIRKELDSTSHVALLQRLDDTLKSRFPHLSEEELDKPRDMILKILQDELILRTRKPFHARLQEALGKNGKVKGFDAFRRTIIEETSQRDPDAVRHSTEAFVRKVTKDYPEIREQLLSLMGQALANPIDLRPPDIDRRRIESLESLVANEPKEAPPYVAQKKDLPQEQSVEAYLESLGYALAVTRRIHDPERRAESMMTWANLRDARVVHIGQDLYNVVYHSVDRYTTDMADLEWQKPLSGQKVSKEENDKYVNFILHEAKRQPYPEKLPFPQVFLGYGTGIEEPLHHVQLHAPREIRDQVVRGWLMGHLMTEEGLVVAFRKAILKDGSGSIWNQPARIPEAGWVRSLDLDPWVLPHFIEIINQHRTFVIEHGMSKQQRRHVRKNNKRLGFDDYKHMPKPYYTLKIQSKILEEAHRRSFSKPRAPVSYRTDVCGHDRCRIRRGPLPIDPKLEARLRDRGYKVFTTNKLDEETYEKLAKRGMAYKKADEWLAIKTTWVKAHYSSNDESLPYIPAVRTLGSVNIQRPARTGSWTEDPGA